MSAREHREWRAMLLTASLKMSRTSRRTSVASARSRPVSGPLNENSMFFPVSVSLAK